LVLTAGNNKVTMIDNVVRYCDDTTVYVIEPLSPTRQQTTRSMRPL